MFLTRGKNTSTGNDKIGLSYYYCNYRENCTVEMRSCVHGVSAINHMCKYRHVCLCVSILPRVSEEADVSHKESCFYYR